LPTARYWGMDRVGCWVGMQIASCLRLLNSRQLLLLRKCKLFSLEMHVVGTGDISCDLLVSVGINVVAVFGWKCKF